MASEQWIVPVEQDTVIFYNQPIVAVRLEDGSIYVVLRWICEGLQLDPTAQVRRIKRTEAIADELINVRLQTEGGIQIMPALKLRSLPSGLQALTLHRFRRICDRLSVRINARLWKFSIITLLSGDLP